VDLTATLAALQAEAETRMRFKCRVTVPSDTPGPPDETGWPTIPAGTVIYTGRFRFRQAGTIAGSANRDVAQDQVFLSSPVASFPVSAPIIPVGAVVEVTEVPADDPAAHLWVGVRMRVVGRVMNSDMTAQRVTVEVVTG
jgi:hypothetical protein